LHSNPSLKKKSRGIKPLIFGAVLALLALLNILFSLITNTEIDKFYLLLTVFGVCLAMFGAWQRRVN
jgi:hypothetical protein